MKKLLAVAIIVLFIGASVIPIISGNIKILSSVKDSNKGMSINRGILTFHPTDDTYISKFSPDSNDGSRIEIYVRNTYGAGGDNFQWDGLIKFDVTSIPVDATIISATLNLYYFDWYDNNPAGRDLNLYRATSDWDEDTVTWNTQPTYATNPTTYSTVPSTFDWMAWNVTDDIQKYVNGTATNQGWKITDENYWGGGNIPVTDFYSKEYGDYTPYLEIETPIDEVYVDDDYNESTPGWGYDHFDSIQDGVDAVNESGTVYVYNGTYYECIRINKSIDLIGEDKNSTIIDGNKVSDVTVRILVDNVVNMSGFTIQNSGYGYSGLCTYANNTNISNNIVKSNGNHGIIVRYWDNNTISNNIVFDNQKNGINIQDNSKNNIISNNNISENGAQGIRLDQSSFNIIYKNRITQNNDDGIALNHASNNNTVINNYIAVNLDDGIQIYGSNTNLILKNEIIENIETGIQITENSNNNQLYHNNIINNTLQANDLCNNYWDNGYPYGGNYWDDYTEDDLYSGPNQDIPGPDGIGDTPYNITGGDNQDLYPLMNPFEQYYILNISAPSEVNEGELFNVFVTSIGGPVVPLAIVEFNDELKLTDSDGRAYFIAPPVETDTYYDITATKDGYTGDTETILVKDVPVEFVSTLIFGRIDNLTTGGDVITFEAVNIRVITLKFPPYSTPYTSGELITISKNPFGFLGALFGVQLIFAFCGLAEQPYTSTISMNRFSHDDFANTVIWLVSGVEGPPLETKDVEMILLNESGQPQPDAEITFNEVNAEGYINPGDTFTVVAPSDGYYVFMLTHKSSGATIYKSSLTHY